MAQDPKKLNPVKTQLKTYPGQKLTTGETPSFVDMLPHIFRTDTNKKVLSSIVEDLFQPSSQETLNFSVGRKTSKIEVADYLPHPTAKRQFEPGLVVYTKDGVETLSADELASAWDFNDRSKEYPVPIGILDLPIDPDKFVNWDDYYWVEEGLPPILLTGATDTTINVYDDIIGKQYYTTPVQRNGKTLELKNGMRLAFIQVPNKQDVNGDANIQFTTTADRWVKLESYDFTYYDKGKIGLSVDGVLLSNSDYIIIGNYLYWKTLPTVGGNVYIHLPDFFVNKDSDLIFRQFQVDGVGAEKGIQLLGRTQQNTRTAYSRSTDSLWDQTAITWDQIEWDGTIPGINGKHYILQQVGAKNRNAHSRVNVWYHRESIQAVSDFLDVRFSDVAPNGSRALRPIVEFENTLELYNHGTDYRSWVLAIEKTHANPAFYIGQTVREVNLRLSLATDLTKDSALVKSIRLLWLANGNYKNKIVTFEETNGIFTEFYVEEPHNGDTVTVNDATMAEYHWKDGVAVKSTYRKSATQQPLFELYSKDNIRLSDYDSHMGFKPSIINSNIIKIAAGKVDDKESGYKIKFLPSHYNKLSADNIAKDAMYDIVYKHTQHEYAYYVSGTADQKTVPGPYSFRRVTGDTLVNELSNGYRRAWYRLKSSVSRTQKINGATSVQLDASMWPTYEWALKINNDKLEVVHTDNFEIVVDNYAVMARNETVSFKLFVPDVLVHRATISGFGIANFTATIENNVLSFVVPANAPAVLTIKIDDRTFKAKVIDVLTDPRNIKVKLNGLPVDFTPVLTREHNLVTDLAISVDAIGSLEIQHQGNVTTDEHISAIPGLTFNPEQISNLGEFSVSRIADGMLANISLNQNANYSWVNSSKFTTMDGIRMVEHSAVRSAWAGIKLAPTLNDSAVSRSLSAWRWHRKFISKIAQHVNMLDLENISPRNALDRILEELLLGITYSSPDAVSGMAFTTNGMNYAVYTVHENDSGFGINTGTDRLYLDIYGPDHIYVYVNDKIISPSEYTIQSNLIVFNDAVSVGSLVEIFHASETSVYSGIPASPSKLGLHGLFKPKFVTETWGTESRKFIRRHDGSLLTVFNSPDPLVSDEQYYPNLIILELESRIYSGCPNIVGDADKQRQIRNYDRKEVLETQARAQLEWYTSNNVSYRDRSDYVSTNPWTWNYGGYSWRGLYLKAFGTYNIHSAPWEALGYDDAPTWWNDWYSWTDEGKRNMLEFALTNGIISEPLSPMVVDPTLCSKHSTFPVGTNGELLDPTAWIYDAPTADEALQPWEIGSLGPSELAWSRSVSGTWSGVLHALDDYNIFSEFFDNSINPHTKKVESNCLKPKGYNSIAPSQFFQDRPSIGVGAIIFEAYREFNLVGEIPLNNLMSLNPRLQISMGGFTDGMLTLKMYHTKYQTGSYVPKEDFYVTLSEGVSKGTLRYTAVRVEKDDVGYRVYGFDPKDRFFTVFAPATPSQSLAYPSTRRMLSTPHGEFIEYLEWDKTNPVVLPYGSYIANKQDLLTFMMGLGEHQHSCGLILDSINLRGTINDWKQSAIDAMTWSEERWGDNHFCVVGPVGNDGIKFSHAMGTLDRLDAEIGRSGKVILNNGRAALANEMLITRDVEPGIDKIIPMVSDQIVFADMRLRNFDHVVYINKKTKFGDLIVDLQTGQRLEVLGLAGRRTYNWTGRPSARGILPVEHTIVPGFDTLVSDIIDSHRPEMQAFDTFKTALARSDAVPLQNSVVFDLIQDNTTAHLFRQGLQFAAGTNLAIDALFRNKNLDIPSRVQDVSVNEQWAFNTGDFGRLDTRRIWEIELRKDDFTNNRQIIRFNNTPTPDQFDLKGDNIVDLIGSNDPRWVSMPGNANFPLLLRSAITLAYSRANGWLPSAGIAQLLDVDIRVTMPNQFSMDSLLSLSDVPASADLTQTDGTLTTAKIFSTKSYSRYDNFNVGDYTWNRSNLYRANTKILGSATNAFDSTLWTLVPLNGDLLPSIWVSDYNGQGWNVLQITSPQFIEEICPNALDLTLNESKVTFANPHNLAIGDSIIVTGSGDGAYDKIHQVKDVVDDYNVLIPARSTGDVIVYNLIGFCMFSVKFNTDAEWHAAESKYSFLPGMKAYIDYGDTEGTYKVITYATDGNNHTIKNVRYSGPMIDTSIIYKTVLVDYETDEVLATIDVFDPYKGLTIDAVAQFIDYRAVVDPAVYNVTDLGLLDDDAVEAWFSPELGKLWWDSSQVRYIEYEQSDDIQYRAAHWGEKFADTHVAVYEWVSSTEEPTLLNVENPRLDYSSGQGQIRYSQQLEADPVTGARVMKYYYWKGKVSKLPVNSTRTVSCAAIESILNDPDGNKVAWISPIQTNALLVANIAPFFDIKDRIILRIEETRTPYQTHTSDMLVTEGFDGSVIDDFLYRRVEASVVGRDNYRETYVVKEYVQEVENVRGKILKVSNVPGLLINGNEIHFSDSVDITDILSSLEVGMSITKVSGTGKLGELGAPAVIKDIIIDGKTIVIDDDILCSCDASLIPGGHINKIILEENYKSAGTIVFNVVEFSDYPYIVKNVNPVLISQLRAGMRLTQVYGPGTLADNTLIQQVAGDKILLSQPSTSAGDIIFNAQMDYYKGDYIMSFKDGEVVRTNTFDAAVGDYPILRNLDDTREDIISVWKSRNLSDNKIYMALRDFTASTLSYDNVRHGLKQNLVKSPACALVKNLFPMDDGVWYALINTRRRVPDLRLHPKRRNGNGYVPYPQSWYNDIVEARRTLVTAANASLLKFDLVSKANWQRYLTTYHPLNGMYSKDLTKYWNYVDYVAEGYKPGREQYRLSSSGDIGKLDSSVTNFAIVDSADTTIEAYNKVGETLTLVYRKNGTIQFKSGVWDGSLGDAWDRGRWDEEAWDEDASEVVESILRALRKDIFIDNELGYFNLLFFALVKESLKQVGNADWISKTTYLDVVQTSNNDLHQAAVFYNKKDALIKDYLNEVKPYHSKIVDTNQFVKSTQEISVGVNESIQLTVTTLQILTTEQEEIISTETGLGFGLASELSVETVNLVSEG
ncbi:hypothetical protein UFOVP71_460 [uncultured Caudovirales phage]|uniref:Uncharacterized protein n=1 Tax=uncultured Caudovirales phage TaxID=2100421 RepID=A0A6J5TAP1_9CAUD|nr:hypothetical protein UFOVP71_460 [uncultured Caudovirales phage]